MIVYSFYESDNRVMRYAETLARRGDRVDVIALRGENLPYSEMLRGVRVIRIQKRDKNERGQLSYMYRILTFMIRASAVVSREHLGTPYDLVHVHNMPDFLVFSALYAKCTGAKVILDIHDVVPELYATVYGNGQKSFLFRFALVLEKVSAAFADHVIVANHIWYNTLTSRSASVDKCSVVLNYPDPVIFFKRKHRKPDGRFIMVYPGSLNHRQGVDIAIRALGLIKEQLPEAELHIYGDGADKDGLERLALELGLEQKVIFKGSLPIYDVAERMASADLGVEPKRNDPFAGDAMSTKILEFMSVGVPVIASDTRVHKYYFNEDVLMFFKNEDEKDLSEAILKVARDEKYRNRLSLAGNRFAEDFSWEKKQDHYVSLTNQLISS
jgi:glycosyltransferase involved in cell wall biosynthesis